MNNSDSNQLLVGQEFAGQFTIKNIVRHETSNKQPYLTFDIKANLQPVRVFVWEKVLYELDTIFHGQQLEITGKLKEFHGYLQLHCNSISYSSKYDQKISLAKANLRALISWLPNDALKEFVLSVFRDCNITDDFFRIPASKKHHHAFSGGLLVHSSDVAMQVFSQHLIPETERYIGTIAGLFHDIGKIRTLSTNSTSPSLYIDHENYTLEILAPHLHMLEKNNKQFADTLRYLLTWKPRGYDRIPEFEVYEAIKNADRISSGLGS